MKKFMFWLSASIVLLLVFSGCSNVFLTGDTSTGNPESVSRVVTSSEYYDSGDTMLKTETGVLDSGSKYTIFFPPGWQQLPDNQKKLMIYSHGYVTKDMDFSETDEYSLINDAKDAFLVQNFAVAFADYVDTGWAVKDGSLQTIHLRNYIVDTFGKPGRIYLTGVSEGALIAVKLAEQKPDLFNGVLAVAGPIGGAGLEFKCILDVRLAFDHFYKKVLTTAALQGDEPSKLLAAALGYDLTGSESTAGIVDQRWIRRFFPWHHHNTNTTIKVIDVHPELLAPSYRKSTAFFTAIAPLLGELFMQDTDKALEFASVGVNAKPLFPIINWLKNPSFIPEFVFTVSTALWYNIYGTGDLLVKTGGKMPLGTDGDVYTYLKFKNGFPRLFPVVFNVERFSANRTAANYLEQWYQPVGGLTIPVVTLHFTRDPAVPFIHELVYAHTEGFPSTMLTQIPKAGFGHGTELTFLSDMTPVFHTDETLGYISNAFSLLVLKVEALSTP